MQDFFHAEDQPGITPGEPANEPNMPNEVTSEPPEALSDPSDAPAARPAATASSYRDIIAERLARKSGGATGAPSPRAHSSDVERATRPIVEVENAAAASMLEGELPANIEASTKLQEIPASEATAGNSAAAGAKASLSGRERALLRQQERAALRRGERSGTMPRMPRTEPESASEPFNAELIEESVPEEAVNTESDVIAARLARKGEERQPRRPERRREESRREEPRREEVMREEPRREEARREQRAPTPAMPPTPSAGLTLRGTRTGASERPEPRRREAAPARRTEVTEPRIGTVPEEKGAGAAVALAAKLGISVVIPLYNEQDSLRELTAALKQQLMRLAGPKYEILYINDGSTDRSGEILQDILATSSRVSLINFRRNLGKSAALAAGFAEAQYGIVITMDADLQDDPREFVNLIAKLAEGYDLVSGWKKKRHDPMSKTGPSKFFNWVTSFFSGIRLHDFNCGLKAYRKEVTESLQVYGELHRYLPALAYWQGFRVTEIPVTHHPRKFGKSKFGSSRFFKGFLDLMSIVFTNRYGKRPLHLFGTIGTLMAIAGFVIDIWLTIEWALGLTSLSNRPILLLGLLLILVGVQLISIGLLGEMIVKNSISRASIAYQKEKGRPSAEAQERRASRAARMARVGGRPRPAGSERRAQPRRS